jgi:hypothetical protein
VPVATKKRQTPPLVFGAREGVEAAVVVVVAQNNRSTPPTRVSSEGGGGGSRCRCRCPEQKEYTPPLVFAARDGVVLTVIVVAVVQNRKTPPTRVCSKGGGGVGYCHHGVDPLDAPTVYPASSGL